jgi:hypothetical protein
MYSYPSQSRRDSLCLRGQLIKYLRAENRSGDSVLSDGRRGNNGTQAVGEKRFVADCKVYPAALVNHAERRLRRNISCGCVQP